MARLSSLRYLELFPTVQSPEAAVVAALYLERATLTTGPNRIGNETGAGIINP